MNSDPQIAPYLANTDCARVGEAQALLGLLYSQLDQNAVVDYILGADITVNPRYGEWDTTNGVIAGSGSISVPFVACFSAWGACIRALLCSSDSKSGSRRGIPI